MAMAFSTQLLLTQNTPVTAKPGLENEKIKPLMIRANSLAATLKEIPCYNHDGLNE